MWSFRPRSQLGDPAKPIVTEVEPAASFWRAEDYHQCYLEKRHSQGGLPSAVLGR